ncbi:hypothetical protein [Parapedobacter koreensis]|uniref:Uncharacterized protein n=1 Tax=Parapedobacter koreensis TaxID=332977 RepID=A0A1H7JTP0_9SPHI|nr:hypothetical protein [Parapedobacter koreensis]SEK78048.1 hypothetical protein SAMN05421740_102674 [Parapedobacter koreensis]
MMQHILIFKTSVATGKDVSAISPVMDKLLGKGNWTVDLDDCDKVLRVCTNRNATEDIVAALAFMDFTCVVLDY